MGYSVNPELLEERMWQFAEMKNCVPCKWDCIESMVATKRLYNQLHEGLYIASLYPQRFPELARAKRMFSLHIVRAGLIEARPKADTGITVSAPMQGAGTLGATVGLTNAQQIIDAWRDHMPDQSTINFPGHQLDELEMMALYDWSEGHEPKLMILAGDGHLSVGLRVAFRGEDPSWRPPQPPKPPEREYDV